MEKELEQKLVREIRREGGLCLKLICPGTDGMPDRLILMPGGHAAFAEVKTAGKKPRPLQRMRHTQLKKLGFAVYVLDEEKEIEGIVSEVGRGAGSAAENGKRKNRKEGDSKN